MSQPVLATRRRGHLHVGLHDLEQRGVVLITCPDLGLGAGTCELQDLERTRRIESLHGARIHQLRPAPLAGVACLTDLARQPAHAEHGPAAADFQHRGPGTLNVADRRMRLGHRRKTN